MPIQELQANMRTQVPIIPVSYSVAEELGSWCYVIVLNVRAPTDDECEDTRDTGACIQSLP
jgi:hypothetical protein